MSRLLGSLAALVLVLLQAPVCAADIERGRALYEGRAALARAGADAPAPGCVACHRPSGLGNFEGGLAVPPISGPTLFAPFDRDTAHYFARSAGYRVRPAYDGASIARLLRLGVAPDGLVMRPAMPRYAIDDADVAAVSAYLRELSSRAPPGIDAGTVRLAMVSTPQADPARRDAMLAVLQRFFALKNGRSRQEPRRAEQAARGREMAMYRKFRRWQLEHWALDGDPSTWAAQLDARQAQAPVYALLAGLGGVDWAPVDDFCNRHRLPCLLPLVEAAPPEGSYALRYHAGLGFDAQIAARRLVQEGQGSYRFATDERDERTALLRSVFAAAGLREVGSAIPAVLVSALAPREHRAWLEGERPSGPVLWLPGSHALDAREIEANVARMREGWIVTPMQTGTALDRQLGRARAWLRLQGMAELPADVAASALFAAAALGEGLTHIDFAFTPEYLLELLEHGLENLVPWSPYPRLAIGPGQRVSSKGSFVGELRGGALRWEWQARE